MAQRRRQNQPLFRGTPHRDYARHSAALESSFCERFTCFGPHTIEECHAEFGIPPSTLYYWYAKWQTNNEWRPWDSDRRVQHRIFTDQEEAMSEYIIVNFIVPGILFTNEDFKDLASQAYLEKYKDSETMPNFQASDGFVTGFKHRNNFSSRRAHAKRRPSVASGYDENFKARLIELLGSQDRDRVINVDETFWRVVPGDLRTWGKRGADSVQIHPRAGEKDGVTVVAAVTASGTKLPLQIIASGKTQACERQLGDVGYHNSAHSASGWTTGDTFRLFLMSLRQWIGDDAKLWVVLDVFAAHRERETMLLAETLNIDMIFIPAGFTDEMQPLDRSIFATLMVYLKRLWRQRFQENPNTRFTKALAVELLLPAWEKISPQLIRSSWNLYDPEISEDDDEE